MRRESARVGKPVPVADLVEAERRHRAAQIDAADPHVAARHIGLDHRPVAVAGVDAACQRQCRVEVGDAAVRLDAELGAQRVRLHEQRPAGRQHVHRAQRPTVLDQHGRRRAHAQRLGESEAAELVLAEMLGRGRAAELRHLRADRPRC